MVHMHLNTCNIIGLHFWTQMVLDVQYNCTLYLPILSYSIIVVMNRRYLFSEDQESHVKEQKHVHLLVLSWRILTPPPRLSPPQDTHPHILLFQALY